MVAVVVVYSLVRWTALCYCIWVTNGSASVQIYGSTAGQRELWLDGNVQNITNEYHAIKNPLQFQMRCKIVKCLLVSNRP